MSDVIPSTLRSWTTVTTGSESFIPNVAKQVRKHKKVLPTVTHHPLRMVMNQESTSFFYLNTSVARFSSHQSTTTYPLWSKGLTIRRTILVSTSSVVITSNETTGNTGPTKSDETWERWHGNTQTTRERRKSTVIKEFSTSCSVCCTTGLGSFWFL